MGACYNEKKIFTHEDINDTISSPQTFLTSLMLIGASVHRVEVTAQWFKNRHHVDII